MWWHIAFDLMKAGKCMRRKGAQQAAEPSRLGTGREWPSVCLREGKAGFDLIGVSNWFGK